MLIVLATGLRAAPGLLGVHHAEAVEDHIGITVIRSALMYTRGILRGPTHDQTESGGVMKDA